MTDNFAAIAALGIGLASPVLIWSITQPRANTFSHRARLFGEVFLVTAAALVLTRFAVIPLLRWLDAAMSWRSCGSPKGSPGLPHSAFASGVTSTNGAVVTLMQSPVVHRSG